MNENLSKLREQAEGLWQELGDAKAEEQKFIERIKDKINNRTTTSEENEKARMLADRVNVICDQYNEAYKKWKNELFGISG